MNKIREKQIDEATPYYRHRVDYEYDEYRDKRIVDYVDAIKLAESAFNEGAEWADENPGKFLYGKWCEKSKYPKYGGTYLVIAKIDGRYARRIAFYNPKGGYGKKWSMPIERWTYMPALPAEFKNEAKK